MSDKKAVFFDIDGTLWDANNMIPDSTRQAIRDLRANGHLAFLNSGRSRAYIFSEDLFSVGFDGIVSACGTMIEIDGQVRAYHRIESDLAEWTVKTVRSFGFKPILEGRYNLYMDSEFDEDPFGMKLHREMGDKILTIESTWGNWEISKLSCDTKECDIDACREVIGEHYTFMIHNPGVVELVPTGYNKGTGIQKVCELLDMDMADTVSFGDSANDLDMLDAAGFSVVMGSGCDEAKEHGDYITTGIYEDGIKNGLEYLGLI